MLDEVITQVISLLCKTYSSFTYGTPTILRLFFLEQRYSSYNLFVCDWIVDSNIVNLSCMGEQVCRRVSFSTLRSMKSFPKSRIALLNCVSMFDSCAFIVCFISSIETENYFVSRCVCSCYLISLSTSLLSDVLFS